MDSQATSSARKLPVKYCTLPNWAASYTKHVASDTDVPDTSGYQYDEASGYYYDPVSGYYYDPGTQYFYDSSKQQYLYWSPEQNKYVPVSETAPSTNQSSSATDAKSVVDKKKEKKLEKPDKVKVAKKIAKVSYICLLGSAFTFPVFLVMDDVIFYVGYGEMGENIEPEEGGD